MNLMIQANFVNLIPNASFEDLLACWPNKNRRFTCRLVYLKAFVIKHMGQLVAQGKGTSKSIAENVSPSCTTMKKIPFCPKMSKD